MGCSAVSQLAMPCKPFLGKTVSMCCRAQGSAVSDAGEVMPAMYDSSSNTLSNALPRLKTTTPGRNDQLLLQHYATRSVEDFHVKQSRGAGDHARSVMFRGDEWFARIQKCVPLSRCCCFQLAECRLLLT